MLDFTNQTSSYARSQARTHAYDEGLRNYMIKVFNNMGIALAISGITAFIVASSPALLNLFFATPLKWVVLFAPLAFIFLINAKISKISAAQANNYLWVFASLMGLSLAPLLIIYTGSSIARAFFVTASLFGAMSLYGYTTKKDLTSMGSFLIMGVIGLVIASIVNIFMQSQAMEYILSILAVIIFTGLTAYDTQRIKAIYFQFSGQAEALSKAATLGALSLYLDFINLFVALVRLFGERR